METPEKKRGLFIVFEGIDRCGKSTQITELSDRLDKMGHANVMMHFPERSTSVGREIDAYLKSKKEIDDKELHQLFCKNRWEFKDIILSHIENGFTVIADRYAFSGVAYSVAKGLDMEWCKEGDIGLPAPDMVFLLDMEAKEAAKRGNYGEERFEKIEFQEKVRTAFHRFFHNKEWITIDAMQHVEVTQTYIVREIDNAIKNFTNKPIQKLWTKEDIN